MARPRRIQRRLSFAIVLTALIPLLAAIVLADIAVRKTGELLSVPEFDERLDQAQGVYQELAREIKRSMRSDTRAIAATEALRKAAEQRDRAAVERELKRAFGAYDRLVALSVRDADGNELGRVDRGRPFDPAKEKRLEVVQPLGDGAPVDDADAEEPTDGALEVPETAPESGRAMLVSVFAANKARFDEANDLADFVDTYKRYESGRKSIQTSYVTSFALLLGITILASIGVGVLLARSVSSRIGVLAQAMKQAGAGDLAIRVPEGGPDELADLAGGFNRMLREIEQSRARIEYLQRIGAWQEMARRLAHEIKNPLTPIQLAVQDIHRRYPADDPEYRKLLDAALEIVEDEVGTLRRLVTEFSDFARLPQAELEEADLTEFLREQRQPLALLEEEREAAQSGNRIRRTEVKIEFELPDAVAPVRIDRQMVRRALINLVRNAIQAMENEAAPSGTVRISLTREGDYFVIDVDDSGPGIPEEMRLSAFDPYVTTKTEGTGLGLAIVKKIVVEHGGSIAAEESPLGGARVRIWLPARGTAAMARVATSRDWQPPSSSRKSVTSGPITGSPS